MAWWRVALSRWLKAISMFTLYGLVLAGQFQAFSMSPLVNCARQEGTFTDHLQVMTSPLPIAPLAWYVILDVRKSRLLTVLSSGTKQCVLWSWLLSTIRWISVCFACDEDSSASTNMYRLYYGTMSPAKGQDKCVDCCWNFFKQHRSYCMCTMSSRQESNSECSVNLQGLGAIQIRMDFSPGSFANAFNVLRVLQICSLALNPGYSRERWGFGE